jgi:hypothetical protein
MKKQHLDVLENIHQSKQIQVEGALVDFLPQSVSVEEDENEG